jgi:dTDP-4-dehydrorhamnose reductase
VLVTGGRGFVGSNLVHVLGEAGDEVLAPSHAELDLIDRDATDAYVRAHEPEAIVHAAIWNAFAGLLSDRRRAWASFVDATRHVTDAANAVGARVVLVSTDWVFDGTQGPAAEDEPPNPTSAYGVLKVVSESVVRERAARSTIARIAGVQGAHRAQARTVREQDAGFGYLVASVIDALREGRPFVVWEGPELNTLASPVSAIDAARLIRRAIARDVDGILHCCGAEHIDRVSLARRAAGAFELDASLVRTGPAPPEAGGGPFDTRLASEVTAAKLDMALPDLDDLFDVLREELVVSTSSPAARQ